MGSLLATVLLAVPLITWLGGTIHLDASQMKLARFLNAPRGTFPIFRNSNSPEIASWPISKQAAWRSMR